MTLTPEEIRRDKPLISIIVATYNCREHLDRLFASLRVQTFSNWELLVSDGGSSDGTCEYVRAAAWSRLAWFESAPDRGIYDALNKALRHAAGEWVLVLGADDSLPQPDTLAALAEQLAAIPETVKLCYGDIEIRSADVSVIKRFSDYAGFKRRYGRFPPIHHQSALVRKAAMIGAGGFSMRYEIHSDYEMMCRIMSGSEPRKISCLVSSFSDGGYSAAPRKALKSLREFYRIRHGFGVNPFERAWKYRFLIQIAHLLIRMALPASAASRLKTRYRTLVHGRRPHANT